MKGYLLVAFSILIPCEANDVTYEANDVMSI